MKKGYARSFKDLRVYQKAREVSRTVFQLTRTFPKEEMYSLTDQFRRVVRSVGAQIAEAWGKRRYEKHFARSVK
jgi:four helix bundle protein